MVTFTVCSSNAPTMSTDCRNNPRRPKCDMRSWERAENGDVLYLLQGVSARGVAAAAASRCPGVVVAVLLADARPQILCEQRVVQRHGEHGEHHHGLHGDQRHAAPGRPPAGSVSLATATPAGDRCLARELIAADDPRRVQLVHVEQVITVDV